MQFQKLSWVDLQFKPKTVDVELDRFYTQLQSIFKRMAGEFNETDRVITVGDLQNLGLI